jgi:hypothetical protein
VAWKQPSEDRAVGALVYYAATNVFGTSTPVSAVYGPPLEELSLVFTPPSVGTWYAWVVALNASDVPASSVATGAIVVT